MEPNAMVATSDNGNDSITIRDPRPARSSSNILEVTSRFTQATSDTKALKPGTLIKDELFTLFESVGALEIGDPKMDSGCAQNEETREDDLEVSTLFKPSQLIWLMDEILCLEVAWQQGYPLSQTIFTSIHIDALSWPVPATLAEAQFTKSPLEVSKVPLLADVLRSYCLGVIKSCDLVLHTVMAQHFYEEEDLATQLFNRELLHSVEPMEVVSLLEESVYKLEQVDTIGEEKLLLHARLSFRIDVLKHLIAFRSDSFCTPWNHSVLQQIETSAYSGTPSPEAFSTKLQRKLASTIPPRPMIVVARPEAFDFYRKFLKQSTNVFDLLLPTHSSDFMTAYTVFNAQPEPPSIYIRTLAESFLDREVDICGHLGADDFVVQDMVALTLAGSPILTAYRRPFDKRSRQEMTVVNLFLSFIRKAGPSYQNVLRTLCLNRSRLRRTLCHALLEWDNFQAEAEQLDEQLHRLTGEKSTAYRPEEPLTNSFCVSSWIYHHKLTQIRLIIQLGFELEVYAPFELMEMYWYLSHICEIHLAHLERIRFYIKQREQSVSRAGLPISEDNINLQECRAALHQLYSHFSLLKATRELAQALHLLYVLLNRHGHFVRHSETYAQEELQFEIRMRPFANLAVPELPSFTMFKEASLLSGLPDQMLFENANAAADLASRSWEEVLKANWHIRPVSQPRPIDRTNSVPELWNLDMHKSIDATSQTLGAINVLRKQAQAKSRGSASLRAHIPVKTESKDAHRHWTVPALLLVEAVV